MDTQTRRALKTNTFAKATASSFDWMSGHRTSVMRWGITAGAIVILAIASLIYWNMSSSAADRALGAALDVYASPLAPPGAPPEPDVYTSASDRAKAANQKFVAVAKQYGWLPQGAKAHYFAGVTYQDLGQTASAETELKSASGSWDQNLANLAKLALAAVYHQTARDPQAIDLYNALAAKPSETVSTSVAQLDLADLYAEEGKMDQARTLWAKVKDADKDGAAGAIASRKLGAKE